MDYKKLSDDQIIELCKEKGIEYYNSKTKKNYAKSTLISRLNKTISEPKEEEEEQIIEYKNEVVWTLSDADKKNNDEYKEIESKLLNCIKSCHDCLYSNGAITGLKASNDIIRIIIFRLFNIIYKNDDIKNEIRNKISLENLDKYEKYLIDIKEFNKSLNIDNDIKLYIMKIIIPILPNIFNSDDMIFNMRNYPNNYNTIINKISELINIDNSELFIKLFADTGGNIYEYFTNSYGKGNTSKELGQFFTPFKLINLLLINIKDYVLIDDDYSIYDCCCGSGGLLNRTSSELGINKNNIYGCEIEKDTIKYALASLLVNNNSLKVNIINKCSLSNNNYIFENKKFNLILTNPPFGIKIAYKDLKSRFEEYKSCYYDSSEIKFEDVYPINTNNAPSLFLQHVIYMLKDDGICAIVLPDGTELSNKSYYNIRKYLIENCKILKVISIGCSVFNSTGVKTKILIFKKQKEGLENHKNIEFLEINKECNEVKLIAIADLDKNYSFKLAIEINKDIIKYNDDIEIKTLGDIASINIGGTPKRDNLEYYNGDNLWVSIRELNNNIIYNTNEKLTDLGVKNSNVKLLPINTILFAFKLSIGKIGIAGVPLYTNEAIAGINTNDDNIVINKYLYYYLYNTDFKNLASGILGDVGSLNKKILEELKIPIPPIEKQKELVKKIDTIDNANKNMINLIDNLNNKIKLESLINKKTEFIEFGQMFDLIKGSIQSSKVVEDPEGDIMFISKAEITEETRKIKYEFYNTNALYIAQAFNGNGKCPIRFYEKNSIHSNLLYHIDIKEYYKYKINIKYIYYYLLDKQNYIEENYQKGCANKSLDVEEFNLMKIPIPSIAIQEEIINYCDNNLIIIENLNIAIEGNKKIIKDIINLKN
jgi:type I restriction-modification system DNA methylase subunit/restriction endonuclease S subunit